MIGNINLKVGNSVENINNVEKVQATKKLQ